MERIINNVKVAGVIGTTTTGSGLGVILDLIPNDIGKLATVVGIILSVVLIFNHLKKGYIEHKKIELEVEILKERLRR